MSEIGNHKLSDSIPHPPQEPGDDRGGKPEPTHETTAEQFRESQGGEKARLAEASSRERMVDIGLGNQQAARQGQ